MDGKSPDFDFAAFSAGFVDAELQKLDSLPSLEKESTGSLGQQIFEQYKPHYGSLTIKETLDNVRRTWIGSLDHRTGQKNLGSFITFVDPDSVLSASVGHELYRDSKHIPDEEDYLHIRLYETPSKMEDAHQGFPPEESLVVLEYGKDGRIVNCRVQAEPATKEKPRTKPWQDEVPDMAGYMEMADDDELQAYSQGFLSHLEEEWNQMEGSPSRDVALGITKKAIDAMGKVAQERLPQEKFQRWIEKVDHLNLGNLLLNQVTYLKDWGASLTDDQIGVVIEPVVKDLMNYFENISGGISLFGFSQKDFQQVLDVASFDDDQFEWKERSLVDERAIIASYRWLKWSNPKKYEEEGLDQKKEERGVVSKGSTKYGESVPVQDKTFVINKYGDQVIVDCSDRNGKIWSANFQLQVPTAEIDKLLQDEQTDFRNIRPLTKVDLVRHAK